MTEGVGENILNFKSISFEFTLSVTEGVGKNILNLKFISVRDEEVGEKKS